MAFYLNTRRSLLHLIMVVTSCCFLQNGMMCVNLKWTFILKKTDSCNKAIKQNVVVTSCCNIVLFFIIGLTHFRNAQCCHASKNSHTYSNRTYLFSICCFIKNTSEVKNNTSVSECCDEVSLLACSVAAACYFSFIANQYLIAIQHVSSYQISQSVSQTQINSLY